MKLILSSLLKLNPFNTTNLIIRSASFSTATCLFKKQMPPRPKLDPADIDGSYLKGTGPGGQKINKTNSAVQLIHKPTGIVVKCQETRSRSQNQKRALEILAEKVELLQKGDQSRAAVVRETKKKRKANRARKSRRKYRKLEEERRKGEEGEEGEEGREEEDIEEEEEEEDCEGEEEEGKDEVEGEQVEDEHENSQDTLRLRTSSPSSSPK